MANTLSVEELRIGNWVIDGDGDHGKITSIHKSGCVRIGTEAWGIVKATPIPLSPEVLEKLGFTQLPHFTIQNSWNYQLGRNRVLSVACIGTPNEMVFINEEEPPIVKNIIVARNYDYDGKTYLHHLQNIIQSLTGKELIYKP